MDNFLQEGRSIEFTAPAGGVIHSQGYLLGDIFGVVAETIAEGFPAMLHVVGCYILPKATVAWVNGAKLYWDDTAKKITNVATSNKYVGIAIADAALGDTTCQVRLGQTSDSNLDVATIGDVVTALEALTGNSRLSSDSLKAGSTNTPFTLTRQTKLDSILASKLYSCSHTVTAGEATAGQVDLDTGFAVAPTMSIFAVYRAGVNVAGDAVKSNLSGGDAGKVRIADGSAYTTTENDVIELLAIKV